MKSVVTVVGKGSAIIIVGLVIFLSIAFVVLLPVGFIMQFFS
jgi:hypothetical protein